MTTAVTHQRLKWWLVHLTHWAVLYAAFVLQSTGALHLFKFAVWILVPVSLLLLTDASIKLSAERPAQPVRWSITRVQSWVTLGLLAWHGHAFTAAAWALVMLLCSYHRHAADQLRAAPAREA